jgi:hypothetical protein
MSIPTSTSVVESTVIKAPLAAVWHHVKLESFSNWYSAISKSDYVKVRILITSSLLIYHY